MAFLRFVIVMLVVAVLISGAQEAHARSTTLSVGLLYKKCSFYLRQPAKLDARKLSKQQVADMAICSAFISGFNFGKTTANIMNETIGPYCLPRGLERGDRLVRIFVSWASRHPHMRRKAAAVGIVQAMRERYGCDERDKVK